MKILTCNKHILSRLRACLATPLRWLKLDGNDAASRAMRHESLMFVLAVAALGGILMINTRLPQPQEPLAAVFAKSLLVWTNLTFILWFGGGLTWLVFRAVWVQWFQGVYRPLALQMLRFLRRITLFLWCGQSLIWACNVFGDHIIRAGAQEQAVMLAIVPVLLVISISRQLFGMFDTQTDAVGDSRVPDDADVRFGALSARLAELLRQYETTDESLSLRATAAHEAGHMLVCAALHETPEDIILHLGVQGNSFGHIKPGVVGIDLDEPRFRNDRACMVWLMLVLQAGAIAEHHLTGREGLGAGNDSSRWLACARIYLANLCDDTIYYADPDNEQEQAHNVRELNALKQQQRALLASFFDLNDAVLRALSTTAQEKRTLRRDDLLPFFARVQFPDGFPRPDLTVLTED